MQVLTAFILCLFLFRYLTFKLSQWIYSLKRGNKDEHSLKLKNPIGFFMCTRGARDLPVNACVLLPLGRAVRDKGLGRVQYLKSNPFLPTFSKPAWHCGDYEEGQNLNTFRAQRDIVNAVLQEMSHSFHCSSQTRKNARKGLMLLLTLENYLIAYLKLSLNTKQWQKQNSDKWTPALKLKPLVLRGD